MENKFEKYGFKKRLSSMIKVDFRRMFTMPRTLIIIGICFVVPILIFVMTSMMEGTPMTDQHQNPILDEFGNPVLMEGFKNVWQMLGAVGGTEATMSMDLVSMCNINMLFFGIAALVCLFISDDFRSGYCKNLFTVRSNKVDYVFSKTLVGFVGSVLMFIAFFIGMLIGGAISSISFELPTDINILNIVMCFLSKLFLSLIFVSIFVMMSVFGKQRTWLCLIGSFAVSMLLFTMIPMVSPLNSTIVNVILSIVGGLLFSFGLGVVSKIILKKSIL